MTVDRERVALVVTALRSGEYKQGKNNLHSVKIMPDGTRKHTWCCLGVACDAANKAGLEMRRILYEGHESFDGADGYLPETVMEWFGFGSSDPFLETPAGGGRTASEVNDVGYYLDEGGADDRGHVSADFGMIAQFFEDTYLKG
jgi:hypothetical protein